MLGGTSKQDKSAKATERHKTVSFFKKETGQNYKNYLAEVRMKEAVKLLMKTDMKTYELAKAVGYNDVRSFSEKFREYFGESPSSYKKSRK